MHSRIRIAVAGALAIGLAAAQGEALQIMSGDVAWTLDAATLRLEAELERGDVFLFSAGREGAAEGVSVSARPIDGGGLEVTLFANGPRAVEWPVVPLRRATDQVIWPLDEGAIFAVADPFWRREIMDREWAAAEALSLPVFGVVSDDLTASWMTDSPFRNTLLFHTNNESDSLIVRQEFSKKAPAMSVAYRFFVDRNAPEIQPAIHYRNYLRETGQFVSMAEKIEAVPGAALLLGAPHAYLWGGDAVTRLDIRRNQWKPFGKRLLDDAETAPDSLAAHIRATVDSDQWAAVIDCASAQWPYIYLKDQVAAGLSHVLEHSDLREFAPPEAAALNEAAQELLARGDFLTAQERLLLNSHILAATYPESFLPPESWGNGISLKMLDALTEAGLERLKLCAPGAEDVARRPWVAAAAAERGWLFGAYDSYHSIHDTKYAGTDNTWETAQMTQELFEGGAVVGANGEFLRGFKGRGRKLNPIVGRPFVEQRIGENFAAVPYNYYFIDCDATGEIHNDFSAAHPMSIEEDAAARRSRLDWIAAEFDAVVGSEGGNAFAVPSIHVGEGILGPFFGWDDADMKNRESKYFRGAYYPPDAPAVNFKPIPLKERFRRLHYDPATRLPLHAAAFHDSVVVTHHWGNAHFKYPEVRATVALTEILYLSPPMYHFNLDEFEKRKELVMEHYRVWSPLHAAYGFAPLASFEFLDDARLVQSARYGADCAIVVNFGAETYLHNETTIPPMSALIDAPAVWTEPKIYTPTAESVD